MLSSCFQLILISPFINRALLRDKGGYILKAIIIILTTLLLALLTSCETANRGACEKNEEIPVLASKAEKGDVVAACRLRWHYEYCEDDKEKATYWLRKGVAYGDAKSQYHYASMLLERNSTPPVKDIAEGIELMKKAAEQDYGIAQRLLGDYFRDGKYVPTDLKQSEYWYRRSAGNGVLTGMYKLADFLTANSHDPKGLTEAYKWSVIALSRAGSDTSFGKEIKQQQVNIFRKAEVFKMKVSLLKRKVEAQAEIDNKRIPQDIFEPIPICKENKKSRK
jgi:TPR repeat protein